MRKNKDCKYRLIKEYPGSPDKGYIIDPNKINFPDITGFKVNYESWKINISHLKNKEFWEEVVKKDYEILSITHPTSDKICEFDKYLSNIYNNEQHFFECFIKAGYNIHSIKRLSDGEIFTVGDNVNYSYNNKKNQTITKKYIIEKIYFIEKERISFYVGRGLSLGLNSIKKVKQPLFTTEDGVDIFEDCEVYQINNNFTISCYTSWKNYYGDNGIPKPGYKWFSTKEAAEEYILMNKPCLSVVDIYNHFNGRWSKCSNLDELKKLVKSKL